MWASSAHTGEPAASDCSQVLGWAEWRSILTTTSIKVYRVRVRVRVRGFAIKPVRLFGLYNFGYPS